MRRSPAVAVRSWPEYRKEGVKRKDHKFIHSFVLRFWPEYRKIEGARRLCGRRVCTANAEDTCEVPSAGAAADAPVKTNADTVCYRSTQPRPHGLAIPCLMGFANSFSKSCNETNTPALLVFGKLATGIQLDTRVLVNPVAPAH